MSRCLTAAACALVASAVAAASDPVWVKIGGDTLVEHGCGALNKLSALIDTTKTRKPAFKMVLTAVGDYAYTRKEDGIIVCPIGCLRP
ncbi:MAG: hypothetical protein IKQ17_13875 [Kiritimatiellae bacterium]|nr:hypothetical protein [Kiritimatiellia bacterium]